MIKGKLKNRAHALLIRRISSGMKDGLVMGGGKIFLPGRDALTNCQLSDQVNSKKKSLLLKTPCGE